MRATIERALRRINVLAVDEPAQPDDYEKARQALEGLVAELATPWGLGAFTWTLDTIPAHIRTPLAFLLAVRLSQDYERPEPEPERTALVRLRAVSKPWPVYEGVTQAERDAERDRLAEEAEQARWM